MLSEAKHLVAPGETLRFAQGDMALPILLVKTHNREATEKSALYLRWLALFGGEVKAPTHYRRHAARSLEFG
jgi:hypothetical protein